MTRFPPTVIWIKFGQIPEPSLTAIKFHDMSSFFTEVITQLNGYRHRLLRKEAAHKTYTNLQDKLYTNTQ